MSSKTSGGLDGKKKQRGRKRIFKETWSSLREEVGVEKEKMRL